MNFKHKGSKADLKLKLHDAITAIGYLDCEEKTRNYIKCKYCVLYRILKFTMEIKSWTHTSYIVHFTLDEGLQTDLKYIFDLIKYNFIVFQGIKLFEEKCHFSGGNLDKIVNHTIIEIVEAKDIDTLEARLKVLANISIDVKSNDYILNSMDAITAILFKYGDNEKITLVAAFILYQIKVNMPFKFTQPIIEGIIFLINKIELVYIKDLLEYAIKE
jgi:hypothetical protein